MVHHRQSLPLGLEAGNNLPGVHTWLDDFQGNGALNRLSLRGHEHNAHAALADLLQQLVRPNNRPRLLADRRRDRDFQFRRRRIENERRRPLMLFQQTFHALVQSKIIATGRRQHSRPFGVVGFLKSCNKNVSLAHGISSRYEVISPPRRSATNDAGSRKKLRAQPNCGIQLRHGSPISRFSQARANDHRKSAFRGETPRISAACGIVSPAK